MNTDGKFVCSYNDDYVAENPDTELEMPKTRVVCQTLRYGNQDCKVIPVAGNRRMLADDSPGSADYEPPIAVFCEADGDDYKCEKMKFDD